MVRIPTHRAPSHPGEILLHEFLEPLGISQSELAGMIGVSFQRVNELVNGKRGMTPDTALRLEQVFGLDASTWLNLQLALDLWQVMHSKAAAEIRKIPRLQTA